jgi:hypothetical protein
MDIISGGNLLTTVVGGTLLTVVINMIKPYLVKKGFNPQIFVVLLGLCLGVIYTAFSYFVPEIYKTQVINFVVQSISTAVLIYEFIWKNFKKTDQPAVEPTPPQV